MGIEKTFAYHKPSDDGMQKITRLRESFSEVAKVIKELAPDSHEKSVALTNLETTAMWAIKAVVCNDPKSEVSQ